MNSTIKSIILQIVALMFCVFPPLITAVTKFPFWIETGASQTVSGVIFTGSGIFISVVCCTPLIKQIKKLQGVAILMFWAVLMIMLIAVKPIIDQAISVCLAGVVGNGIALPIMWLSKHYKRMALADAISDRIK